MIAFSRLSKQYGRQILFVDTSFQLNPGEKVGLVGPNGAGKTTLFRMIVGQEKADAGVLRVGETVKIAYVDQSRDTLNGENTVFEEITGGTDYIMLGKQKVASRG
ncbi:MAG: ATP-binding cassette domain-containing protein, partial [Acidobacteria bacterium]|nr:ATP-binding cassette domain-containing protein [Acidobacteriota bacterium]